jgi:transglutaminase-like putative cysteine protease
MSRRRPARAWTLLAGCALALLAPTAPAAAQESWDAIYIGGDKVGHTHIRVAPVKDGQGRDLQRVQVNTVLSFRRGRDRVNMELRYGTIETNEGSVLRLDTRTLAGKEELRTYGDVVDGSMNLILEGGGQRREVPIPWAADVRGPYAAELSLSRDPIAPGASRELKTFIPDLNRVCTTRLKALSKEDVTLGGGASRNLLRVEQTVVDAEGKPMPELDTTIWVDDAGQILKSSTALLGGMEAYRTTRAGALAPNGRFDLLAATIIKAERPLTNANAARAAVYNVTLTGSDPATTFPADQRQQFTPGSTPGTGQLRVQSDAPQAGAPAANAPDAQYLRANPLINSDDPTVKALTRRAVGTRTDPWQQAVAIQDWVFKNMRRKNFSTAFASAKEVAKNLEGDCSEHGVLTAAMTRAAGIPTRVVVGLVYAPDLGGFGPHLWNEVFVNGRWVAIDATFNQSEVDATHLKLAESSLDGVAPFEAFLPVVRIFNQLKLDAVELR